MPNRFIKLSLTAQSVVVLCCLFGCGSSATSPKENSPSAKSAPAEQKKSSAPSDQKPASELNDAPTKAKSENDGPVLAPPEPTQQSDSPSESK